MTSVRRHADGQPTFELASRVDPDATSAAYFGRGRKEKGVGWRHYDR